MVALSFVTVLLLVVVSGGSVVVVVTVVGAWVLVVSNSIAVSSRNANLQYVTIRVFGLEIRDSDYRNYYNFRETLKKQ